MTNNFLSLQALSPLDGRYANKTDSLRNFFSEQALLFYRVKIEIDWLITISQYNLPGLGNFSNESLLFLNNLVSNFNVNDAQRIKEIEAETNHDVKSVEYWLKEKIGLHKELNKSLEFIHFACTSEDINNLAYGLILKNTRKEVILPNLSTIHQLLNNLAHQYADTPMLSHTHGQTATPTTVGKEFANFSFRLNRAIHQIQSITLQGKLNGAVGNYNAHCVAYPNHDWPSIAQDMIENRLGLAFNPYTTQIEPHDFMAELFDAIARANNILMDLNRDMWSYISLGYFRQKPMEKEVGSSTMPHKINPIDFENSEGNIGLSNTLLTHFSQKLPISRMQRDLSDSTVLRNIGVAFGYAVIAYKACQQGLKKIEVNNKKLEEDLEFAWEVIAEPIQTVMRRNGIKNPYEQLKSLTRGRKIDQALIHQFIQTLSLPDCDKKLLLKLTPDNYTGQASNLAKSV